MAGDTKEEVGPRQPHDRGQAQVTTVRKAIIIGALVALLVGGASGLATARLTDRQSDLDEQRAEITQLASQVSQQEAQIAQLASQVHTLEAEKTSLEEQLSLILNPAPGPTPAAALTVSWVQRWSSYDNQAVVCVEIENTSDGDISISYSYSQFAAIDGENFAYPPRLPDTEYFSLRTSLRNGQLSPGQIRRGELLFDVPSQAVLTRLVWHAGFGEAPEIAVDLPAAQGTSYTDPPAIAC